MTENAAERAALARILANAKVIAEIEVEDRPPTRSAQAIQTVVLEGGVKAFFKRGDVDPPARTGVRREIAAYEIACLLEWEDLFPIVSHRKVHLAGGGETEIAATELLLGTQESPSLDSLLEEQVKRAGVIDMIIANSDRLGHNWLGVVTENGMSLKLIDHELAFGNPGTTNSSFADHIGHQVPVRLQDAVHRLAAALPDSAVREILPEEEFTALVRRVDEITKTF